MIALADLSPADAAYWACRPVAVAVTRGHPAGMEEICLCEMGRDCDWQALARRHTPNPEETP